MQAATEAKTIYSSDNLDYSQYPDLKGHFGPYGGQFVAETLMVAINELAEAYEHYKNDPAFIAEFKADLKDFVGRPSPLYYAERWSNKLGGAQVYLKREDLNHTGAHKVNNTVGQALLAKRMGKRRARHSAPGAQRLPDEAAGRYRGTGGIRLENLKRRPQRSATRLGNQRRSHVLHHRHRGRPSPLSYAGA